MELNKLIEEGIIPERLPWPSNEKIHEYRNRQVNWWMKNLNGSEHPRERNKDYVEFIKRIKENTGFDILTISDDKKIGEVCGGAWGGLINIYFKKNEKYQIDLLSDFFSKINVIKGTNTNWILSPMEHISLQDNQMDYLFAFNSLDHGWDIEKAIHECVRVSKCGILSFNVDNHLQFKWCPNNDHYQKVRMGKVISILNKIDCVKKWWLKSFTGKLWHKTCRNNGLIIEIYYKK